MKIEELEKVAKEYAMDNIPLSSTTKREIMMESFLAGADWYIKSMWHNPKTEAPDVDTLVLVEKKTVVFGNTKCTQKVK